MKKQTSKKIFCQKQLFLHQFLWLSLNFLITIFFNKLGVEYRSELFFWIQSSQLTWTEVLRSLGSATATTGGGVPSSLPHQLVQAAGNTISGQRYCAKVTELAVAQSGFYPVEVDGQDRGGGGGPASPNGKIDPDIVFPEFGTGSGLRPVVTDLNAEKAHAFLVFLNQTKKKHF